METFATLDRVLAALDEYFELKRDIGAFEEPNIFAAKDRAGRALNEYIQFRFDSLMLEEKRRSHSITTKIKVPDTASIKFTWEDVVALLDALNTPPNPPKHNDDMLNKQYRERWMKLYSEWYTKKRIAAMNSISPPLDIDLSDDWNHDE